MALFRRRNEVTDTSINTHTFQTLLHLKSSYFAERLFRVLKSESGNTSAHVSVRDTSIGSASVSVSDSAISSARKGVSVSDGAHIRVSANTSTQSVGVRDSNSNFANFSAKNSANANDSSIDNANFHANASANGSANDSMSLHQLQRHLVSWSSATFRQKLHFLFRLYDVNNRGSISRDDLLTMLTASLQESSLHLSEKDVSRLTDALFDDVSPAGRDVISWDQWLRHFQQHPHHMHALTVGAPLLFNPPKRSCRFSIPRRLTLAYFLNNRAKVIFTVAYVMTNIALFLLNVWLYNDYNWLVMAARGAGLCLDFNISLVLVLMLRKTLTLLRCTPLFRVLPLDQHVMFHKMAGYVIVCMTLIHTLCHLVNSALYVSPTKHLNLAETLFTLKADVGWVSGFAPLSGMLLLVLIIPLYLCSMEFVRSRGYFEVFYWTHKLCLPFIVLTILHATHFWKWIIVPAALYCLEQTLKLKGICCTCSGMLYLHSATLLPSQVTELTISRPPGFRFRAGDYIFLNIPTIARYEWHPFTISSAPEMTDVITVHIRSVGHWTRRVFSYFDEDDMDVYRARSRRRNTDVVELSVATLSHLKQGQKGDNCHQSSKGEKKIVSSRASVQLKEGLHTGPRVPIFTVSGEEERQAVDPVNWVLPNVPDDSCPPGVLKPVVEKTNTHVPASAVKCNDWQTAKTCQVHLPVYVDGPYGTPCRHILEVEHAVLIGSGIGVTPFASVLQSMTCRLRQKEPSSPLCPRRRKMSLKKVDFIWVNRDHRNFQWLMPVLTKLEHDMGSSGHVIDMHMYVTSALGKEDVRGVGLQMALEAVFRADGRDMLTGLHTPTRPGRPDFDQIFTEIKKKADGTVKVFFCGSHMMAKAVKLACQHHGFHFSREHY